ncbi:hypothetical protein GSI_00438 [Ganoderma sinense ZZ0214-1]|uniref:Uncharacterized protein n=1 Tax=Ganoderma sinense ZZ0214-1 TaxID=1077348 RepID=A0A2G8SSK5_9APHY|nr:hypothetical protein GSI_00438 [Ganoderma sinense ZZ0214-1]
MEIAHEPALRLVLASCEELQAINAKIQELQVQLEVLQAAVDSMDSPRHMKKRKLDVCDSGLRAEPTERGSAVPLMTNSGLRSDVDPEGTCDRTAYAIRASLADCMMAKKRLLAKCRSNWTKKTLQKDFKDSLDKSSEDCDAEDAESDFSDDDKDDDDRELPVFTCSARDYMRIKKKTLEGDGDPVCFAHDGDTEIPALSRWISTLTIPAKEQATLHLFVEVKNVLASVTASLEEKPHLTPQDRAVLQGRWRSNEAQLVIPPTAAKSKRTARELRAAHYGVRATGIVARLVKSFEGVSNAVCRDLEDSVTCGLEQMCRDHARLAAGAVVGISDNFASDMHWRTYRATLRRHGIFKKDLNIELTMAFTQRIANSWTHMIRVRLASSFRLKQRAMAPITALLDEFTASVPDHLKACAKKNQVSALNIARTSLGGARNAILRAWEEDLKRITRLLVPFVQLHLTEGYELAAGAERKKGISALQKKIFRDHLIVKKDTMFDEAGLALRKHLVAAIQKVRDTLDEHLEMVAKKVEMHMATLWESPVVTEDDVKTRNAALATLAEHKAEVERWIAAPRHSLRNGPGNPQ